MAVLCNGDHLPAVNNIIYLVRQALPQCYWGPKSGFHPESSSDSTLPSGFSWEPWRNVEMCTAHPIQLPMSGAMPKVLVGESLFSVCLAQLGLLLRGYHFGGVSHCWGLHGFSCLLL